MADITTVWDGTAGDWVLIGAALASGNDLTTAVLISLFTDAGASPDDRLPTGATDPRGWWGDSDPAHPIGSKLWIRARSKQTPAALADIRNDIRVCLQWLLDDKIAAAVDVDAWWVSGQTLGFLAVVITITQPGGVQTQVQFQTAWQGVS